MTPERELWSLVEPVHAIAYFAPRVSGSLADLGLHGFWNGYFAGRAAPLGAVGPAPVTALFFGFEPTMVAKAVPKVWGRISPADAVANRLAAAGDYLRPLLAELDPDAVRRTTDLLTGAATAAATDGRALAAAWQDVPVPEDTAARLWWAATVIREHRGDGHVLSATLAGLSGLGTMQTHIASGLVSRALMQSNRGWTDDQWNASIGDLIAAGVLEDEDTLTSVGVEIREQIEDETDHLAAAVLVALDDLDAVRPTLAALGRAIAAAGALPAGNPMGVPFPTAE